MTRRLTLLSTLIPLFLIISGCSKDDCTEEPPPKANPTCFSDNKITISEITGVPEGVVFDKVKVEVSGFDWAVIDVIEAEYKNGVAVIELPGDYPADQLFQVSREDAFDYTGFWPAKADNLNALVAGLKDFDVYNGDEKVGMVSLNEWDGEGSPYGKSLILYHYTNEPFSLSGYNFTTGGNRASYKYELSFQQGWNAYAQINAEESAATCTTTIPEELDTRWRFKAH